MNSTSVATSTKPKTHLLLDGERQALARIAAGHSLAEVLDELLRAVEARSDVEMLASILLLDKEGRRLLYGAAPSLPKAYSDAIHGAEIGPVAGSCGSAAYFGKAVFVTDIANDPLWANYRVLARTHGLRACWSTPISGSDGRLLGTFAVYYREPRSPTERDRESIALVSHAVAMAIEHDGFRRALRESQERLSCTLEAAGIAGTWGWRVPSDTFNCDARLAALLSLDPSMSESGAPLSTYLAGIHPKDVARVRAAIEHTIATGDKYSQEFRWMLPDGSIRWLVAWGECHHDLEGKPLRVAGAIVDITARKQAEEALREQTQRLEAFNRFSKSISLDLDLERIVQTVTDIATELSGAKFGAFFYNVDDDRGEQLFLYTLSGAPREAFARFGLPRNTAIFAQTFGGTGVVRSDDIRTDPRYGKSAPHFGMPKGHLPVVSYLAVPVVSRSGQVHGGLFFGHDRSAIFTKEAEDIVRGIAAHAANAIDNARLLEAAEAEIAEHRTAEEYQRQRTEAELKEGEARLQEALAAGQVMAFEWDCRTGQSHRSENAAEILGFEPSLTVGRSPNDFLARVHPDDSARFKAHLHGLRRDNPSYAVSFRYVRPDGREVWLEETARGQFDADGRCVRLKGLTRDITERKRAEEQQGLLIAELDHRVKNVLSCVSAVMERTGESSGSTCEFINSLKRRIRSMANTHSLLSRGRWHGASLADLVRCELAPWEAAHDVTAVGPDVLLTAEATQAIAMVLHELTTNAAKYGALSTEHGRVCVRWNRRWNGGAPEGLLLKWQEKGGPFVAAPAMRGYGTSVIRDLIPYELGGVVDLVFARGGVRCTVEIPAKWLGDTRQCNFREQPEQASGGPVGRSPRATPVVDSQHDQ